MQNANGTWYNSVTNNTENNMRTDNNYDSMNRQDLNSQKITRFAKNSNNMSDHGSINKFSRNSNSNISQNTQKTSNYEQFKKNYFRWARRRCFW